MLDVIWQYKSNFQLAFLLFFVILAFWRGAAPEHQAAGVLVGMFFGDRIYHAIAGLGLFYRQADLGHIVIDTVALCIFVKIALRANRIYPLWLASFQLMTIVAHIVRAISPGIVKGAYAVLVFAPSYLLILAFGVGVVLHTARLKKFGRYRSWRDS